MSVVAKRLPISASAEHLLVLAVMAVLRQLQASVVMLHRMYSGDY